MSIDTVFLIGNGDSRKNFDLNSLRNKGIIIGCNALYRDFTPDILCTVDRHMFKEIMSAGYDTKHKILIPRKDRVEINADIWKPPLMYNTTGCFAMQYIQFALEAKICYMLGMDGYGGNVYLDTATYYKPIRFFDRIIKPYLNVLTGPTHFVNVNIKDAWEVPVDNKYYEYITYNIFKQRIGVDA